MKHVAEIIGGVLIIAASLAFDFGTLSTVAPKLVALYAIAAIGFGMLARHLLEGGAMALSRFDVALAALFAWAALSISWSPDPAGGIYYLIHIAVFLAVYLTVKHIPPDSMRRVATWGVTISIIGILILVAGAETKTINSVNGGFGNANFMSEYLMIGTPFVAWLFWHRRTHLDAWLYAAIILAALYVMFFITGSRMPYVGLGAVLIVAAWYNRHSLAWVFGIVVLVAAVSIHWGSIEQPAIHSVLSRLEIWFNSAFLWAERPFLGWGLGSFAYEYDRVHYLHLRLVPELFAAWPTIFNDPAQFTSEAHNEIVQMAVEIGAVGLLLAGAALWYLVQGLRSSPDDPDDSSLYHHDKTYRPFLIASLAITGAASLVEFPLHNPATSLLVAVAAGILLRGDACLVTLRFPRLLRIPAASISTALMAGVLFFGTQVYAGFLVLEPYQVHTGAMLKFEAAKRAGKDASPWGWANPAVAFVANVDAWRMMPLDPWRRRQLMLSLGNLVGKHPDKVILAPEAADLAYRIANTAAPHTPAVMINRIMYLMETGRMNEDEIPTLLNRLSRNGFRHAQYWVVEGWYSLHRGYPDRAARAVKKATTYNKGPSHDINRLAQAIEKVRNRS